MMKLFSSFQFGKVVRANSEREAITTFSQRKKYGIGCVIFTPAFKVPEWSEAERDILSSEVCFAINENEIEKINVSQAWQAAALGMTSQWFKLSYSFNNSDNARIIQFYNNEDLSEGPHRDLSARKGWMHHHISGAGMVCINPIAKKLTPIPSQKTSLEEFAYDDIKMLLNLGEIEMVPLEEGQAAIFDDTFVHMSGAGNRFRVLTIG